MQYQIEVWAIEQLVTLLDQDQINIKPPYQRNFIWTPSEQSSLITSIKKGYPLPSFFFFLNNGIYDIVDGQQRTRSIYRFIKGTIKDNDKEGFSEIDQDAFLKYSICVTVISTLNDNDSLEQFYALVNRAGKKVNDAEIHKAQFSETRFLSLVEDITESQQFKNLDLFRNITIIRMNDRDFIEEIVTFLKYGITDKKLSRDRIFRDDLEINEVDGLKDSFFIVLDKITKLNDISPLNKTRFRQKNDFYTLFTFIYTHAELAEKELEYLYQVLLIIAVNIYPSNEKSSSLKEYAINCVSQSNSKAAREKRLEILTSWLISNVPNPSIEQLDLISFYKNQYGIEIDSLIKIGNNYTFDIATLKESLNLVS